MNSLLYRADTPTAYADALLRLVRHARTSTDTFTFGPTSLADAGRDGITVTADDYTNLVTLLAAVPGLAQTDH